MPKKTPPKNRNPHAAALADKLFQPKTVPDKKKQEDKKKARGKPSLDNG